MLSVVGWGNTPPAPTVQSRPSGATCNSARSTPICFQAVPDGWSGSLGIIQSEDNHRWAVGEGFWDPTLGLTHPAKSTILTPPRAPTSARRSLPGCSSWLT